MPKLKHVALCSLFATSAFTNGDLPYTGCCESDSFELVTVCSAYLSARQTVGKGIGYRHGYTEVEAFLVPVDIGSVTPFIDLRGIRFLDNEYAASAGLGLRFSIPCSDWAFGVNGFYDFRTDSSHHLHFQQIGAGIEFLSPCIDIRLNGYFPLEHEKLLSTTLFDDFVGGYFMIRKKFVGAFTGFNLEVAGVLKEFCDPCCNYSAYLYGGLGPYYYRFDDHWSTVGGQIRLGAFFETYFAIFSLQGIASRDKIFGTNIAGQFGITFPLGCCCEPDCGQDVRRRPVYRNDVIVLDRFCKWETNF